MTSVLTDASDTEEQSVASQDNHEQSVTNRYDRSKKVVTDSISALVKKQGLITQRHSQINKEAGQAENFNEMQRHTEAPDSYTTVNDADLQDGINLICGCYTCGTAQTSKPFIIHLDFDEPWSIPRILKQVQCPDCQGSPGSEEALIGTMAFYNCKWTIIGGFQTSTKGKAKESEIKISEQTPLFEVTYLLSQAYAPKLEYAYLNIWCRPLT